MPKAPSAIRIGRTSLPSASPSAAALDACLLASIGCSAEEVERLLEGRAQPASFVARALTPFLAEPPARADLARMIAAAGVDKVRRKARALYQAATRPKKDEADGTAQVEA